MMAFRQSVFLVPAAAEIAQRQGFFEKRGVKVANVPVLSSGGQRDDLDTGRAEVGITAIDNLLAWNASGSDIALIGQIETTTDLTLMLRPGLASVQDLEVIRLAVDAPTNGFAIVAYAMLSRLGISPDSTRWSRWAEHASASSHSPTGPSMCR
ncbi:hypothetical protein NJ76_28290 [Rhodococcus sp. IITR03]|nr:hypothetical protein NJ76_28290 [Rhodococcus sp. IITR03]